jgi:hypothetical protein
MTPRRRIPPERVHLLQGRDGRDAAGFTRMVNLAVLGEELGDVLQPYDTTGTAAIPVLDIFPRIRAMRHLATLIERNMLEVLEPTVRREHPGTRFMDATLVCAHHEPAHRKYEFGLPVEPGEIEEILENRRADDEDEEEKTGNAVFLDGCCVDPGALAPERIAELEAELVQELRRGGRSDL